LIHALEKFVEYLKGPSYSKHTTYPKHGPTSGKREKHRSVMSVFKRR